jgi:putative multiple sugar transport system ATP-binding protein
MISGLKPICRYSDRLQERERNMEEYILEMENIIKEFPGVKALNNVSLKVKTGSVHALVGENGAGKSTLMNVLSGVYPFGTYTGNIKFEGNICEFKRIKDSEAKGIAIIHQELALIPYLSIAENIFLGNERAEHSLIDWDLTYKNAKEMLNMVGLSESPNTLIKDIGVGKQQLVEIAKALSKDTKLLILDEPTASLNETDSENLLNLILDLKSKGITSIIISHKLNEIEKVADEITIIRDGSTIETLVQGKDVISENRIIKGMVGRDMTDRFPARESHIGEIAFEIKDWTVDDPVIVGKKRLNQVNLNVRKGEVVGIAGLMGAGRTELAMSIFGRLYGNNIHGKIFKDGKQIQIKSVEDAIKNKISYVTEDRKSAGLILIDDIRHNITLSSMSKISNHGVVDDDLEIELADESKKQVGIKCSDIFQKAGNLSGGNQQKVVLSKWIMTEPDILILDEPTRGIDVGAKYEIYTIINQLASEGKCVIMISSELPEVLGISDRVYVMNDGAIVGELSKSEANPESVMQCIMRNNRIGA